MKNWKDWTFRKYRVTHSRDGFRLHIYNRHVFDFALDHGVSTLLKVLGDPCCGEGPLAKVKISYATLGKLGVRRYDRLMEEYEKDDETFDPSEDAMDMVWFDVLQQSCRFYYLNQHVCVIPLTDEQANTIRPLTEWWFTFDDDDAVRCCVTGRLHDGEWHSYGCENFQGHTLER